MQNEKHFEHGKECCDLWSWKGKCINSCDTYFKLCITKLDMPGNRVPCDVAEITTDSFKSLSSVIFGKSLPGGQKNPMKFKFQKTTVSFFPYFFIKYIYSEKMDFQCTCIYIQLIEDICVFNLSILNFISVINHNFV